MTSPHQCSGCGAAVSAERPDETACLWCGAEMVPRATIIGTTPSIEDVRRWLDDAGVEYELAPGFRGDRCYQDASVIVHRYALIRCEHDSSPDALPVGWFVYRQRVPVDQILDSAMSLGKPIGPINHKIGLLGIVQLCRAYGTQRIPDALDGAIVDLLVRRSGPLAARGNPEARLP